MTKEYENIRLFLQYFSNRIPNISILFTKTIELYKEMQSAPSEIKGAFIPLCATGARETLEQLKKIATYQDDWDNIKEQVTKKINNCINEFIDNDLPNSLTYSEENYYGKFRELLNEIKGKTNNNISKTVVPKILGIEETLRHNILIIQKEQIQEISSKWDNLYTKFSRFVHNSPENNGECSWTSIDKFKETFDTFLGLLEQIISMSNIQFPNKYDKNGPTIERINYIKNNLTYDLLINLQSNEEKEIFFNHLNEEKNFDINIYYHYIIDDLKKRIESGSIDENFNTPYIVYLKKVDFSKFTRYKSKDLFSTVFTILEQLVNRKNYRRDVTRYLIDLITKNLIYLEEENIVKILSLLEKIIKFTNYYYLKYEEIFLEIIKRLKNTKSLTYELIAITLKIEPRDQYNISLVWMFEEIFKNYLIELNDILDDPLLFANAIIKVVEDFFNKIPKDTKNNFINSLNFGIGTIDIDYSHNYSKYNETIILLLITLRDILEKKRLSDEDLTKITNKLLDTKTLVFIDDKKCYISISLLERVAMRLAIVTKNVALIERFLNFPYLEDEHILYNQEYYLLKTEGLPLLEKQKQTTIIENYINYNFNIIDSRKDINNTQKKRRKYKKLSTFKELLPENLLKKLLDLQKELNITENHQDSLEGYKYSISGPIISNQDYSKYSIEDIKNHTIDWLIDKAINYKKENHEGNMIFESIHYGFASNIAKAIISGDKIELFFNEINKFKNKDLDINYISCIFQELNNSKLDIINYYDKLLDFIMWSIKTYHNDYTKYLGHSISYILENICRQYKKIKDTNFIRKLLNQHFDIISYLYNNLLDWDSLPKFKNDILTLYNDNNCLIVKSIFDYQSSIDSTNEKEKIKNVIIEIFNKIKDNSNYNILLVYFSSYVFFLIDDTDFNEIIKNNIFQTKNIENMKISWLGLSNSRTNYIISENFYSLSKDFLLYIIEHFNDFEKIYSYPYNTAAYIVYEFYKDNFIKETDILIKTLFTNKDITIEFFKYLSKEEKNDNIREIWHLYQDTKNISNEIILNVFIEGIYFNKNKDNIEWCLKNLHIIVNKCKTINYKKPHYFMNLFKDFETILTAENSETIFNILEHLLTINKDKIDYEHGLYFLTNYDKLVILIYNKNKDLFNNFDTRKLEEILKIVEKLYKNKK